MSKFDAINDSLDIEVVDEEENPTAKKESKIVEKDKKDYGYLCKDEPMCNHCDKALCRTRKFGIGTRE